jgi:hypothetical protein
MHESHIAMKNQAKVLNTASFCLSFHHKVNPNTKKKITHLSPEGNVGEKKGASIFFSKIIFLDTTDHENSFPKIRSDPSWA